MHTYIYRLRFSAGCPYKQHQAVVSWYAHTSSLCYCHKCFHSWSLLGWQQTRLSTACSYILGSAERVEGILSSGEKCKVKLHRRNPLWLSRTEEWNRPVSWSSLFSGSNYPFHRDTGHISESTTHFYRVLDEATPYIGILDIQHHLRSKYSTWFHIIAMALQPE